jgi:hypothetical protein
MRVSRRSQRKAEAEVQGLETAEHFCEVLLLKSRTTRWTTNVLGPPESAGYVTNIIAEMA